jgi:hypothetical protein
MVNLENEAIQIHQEVIRRETSLQQALRQSGMVNPTLFDRALPAFGETLIRVGTRLKEHTYHQLTSEEASVPTFLIML